MKRVLLLFGVLILLGAGCAPDESAPQASESAPPASEAPSPQEEPKSSRSDASATLDVNVNIADELREEVRIRNFAYSRSSLAVPRGAKIVFTNDDDVAHSVTSDDGSSFNSGLLESGQTFVLDTANLAPGSYAYHCTPHPFMTGSITVQ